MADKSKRLFPQTTGMGMGDGRIKRHGTEVETAKTSKTAPEASVWEKIERFCRRSGRVESVRRARAVDDVARVCFKRLCSMFVVVQRAKKKILGIHK